MKHRLRHPIRSITEPYGKAGLIIACLALIAALGGTALAAKGLFTKAQEKKIAAIAKKFAGKPGAPGAQGPAGPAGPQGEKGPKGDKGDPGNNGTSVTGTPIPAGPSEPTCNHQGGVAYTSASGTENVCNGKEGSPWTAGGTLPSEKTETGTWSVSAPATPECSGTPCGEITLRQETNLFTTISFPIPLARPATGEPAFDGSHVVYVGLLELFLGTESTQTKEACPSTIAAHIGSEPLFEAKAAPGYLCVYEGNIGSGGSAHGVEMEGNKAKAGIEIPTRLTAGVHGAGAEGAVLRFTSEGTGMHYAAGVWAVTAP